MLLKQLNKAYWYIGFVIYVLFSFFTIRSRVYLSLYLSSLIPFLLFGIVLWQTTKQQKPFFTASHLFATVLIYSLAEVLLFHQLSLYIDGDTFLFSKIDAIEYYTNSMKMMEMSFVESFRHLSLQGYNFDDWGAFFGFSTLLSILPEKWFVHVAFCVIGACSAVLLFQTARNLMPRRYAYLSALAFAISSYTVTFHALFLKETLMVFLVITAFYFFYTYLRTKKALHFCLSFLFAGLLMFYRVPVSLLLLFSFTFFLFWKYRKNLIVQLFFIVSIAGAFGSFYIQYTYNRYLQGGDINVIAERKNTLAKGGGIVNQLADPLGALIGPFPSIVAKEEITPISLNASGLLYRLLLVLPFAYGVFYVVKYKQTKLYPLLLFFLLSAIGVAIAVKGLEIRLTFPQLPTVYLFSFWFLAICDYRRTQLHPTKKAVYTWIACVVFICILWNIRNLI
jgi:hypothetical protein